MADLAKCPCGFVPASLCIDEGSTHRWRIVSANCENPYCPGWTIEVRVENGGDIRHTKKQCIDAWNNAMRDTK